MAFNQASLEDLTDWCRDSLELATERREARARFFGADDPRPTEYWAGAGDVEARQRRFLGYFLFDCELPSGERPADAATRRLYEGAAQAEALTAVAGARFVVALAKSIVGRSVYLDALRSYFRPRRRANEQVPLAKQRRLFAERWQLLVAEMATA